nr:MAG TPA: hypothetical protein [Caudoviricetes sp.]
MPILSCRRFHIIQGKRIETIQRYNDLSAYENSYHLLWRQADYA